MIDKPAIRARFAAIKDLLDERGRRLLVATEKLAAGYGGTAAVSRATDVAHSTIVRGAKDLLTMPAATAWVRRQGNGAISAIYPRNQGLYSCFVSSDGRCRCFAARNLRVDV